MSSEYFKFHSLRKKLSVTSVRFFHSYILAGVGGDLFIFGSSESSTTPRIFNIFDNSVVHGIVPNIVLSKLCVIGGHHAAILDVNFNSSTARLTVIRKWRENDWVLCGHWVGDHVAVLSAHNVLSLLEPSTGDKLSTVHCMEKCILYSATILPNTNGWKDTVVIAGTVFQQIIIWAVGMDSSSERPVLHKLCGHKGVIFSVTYNECSRLICSTSDDRSVRVWSVVSASIGPLTADAWKDASVALSVTIFRHTARVWQSYILADERIISIGEDSMLCLWSCTGESISQREAHQGGGMWCVDVNKDESLVVTGGADGGVVLWPLDPHPVTSIALPLPPTTPRRVALLQDGHVITVNEGGRVMVYRDHSWSSVFEDIRISNYCLLEVSPLREFVALATINGHIIVLRSESFEVILDRQVSQNKIYSMHWLDKTTLLTCHDLGHLYVWRITESGLEEMGRSYLPACKERWTTSAVMCRDTVVYGDRAGNIHSSAVLPQHANFKDEIHTVRRAHSRLGVCSLTLVRGLVWSTGRDGMLRQFSVSDTDHKLVLVAASRLQLDWVAAVLHTPLLAGLVVCFHESRVVLWDTQNRHKLLSLQCGGGHRSWSCLVQDGNLIFTFLKDKTAHLLHSVLLPIPRPVLLEGFHTREVNSMAHVAGGLVVSGGEDGSVRLSQFSHNEWTTCAVECNHLSSVRAVTVAITNQQMLIFSAGGRAQMKVWRVSLDGLASLTEVTSNMLREEKKGRHWLNIVPVSDPETRYMDLHILPGYDTDIDVLAACSDSYLRIFRFDISKSELCLVRTVKNSCYCMLRVSSFRCGDSRTIIVTTATDGKVTFWDWETCEVIFEDPLHQSGINGLSVRAMREVQNGNHVLIASGGDDNSVVVSLHMATATPRLSVQRVDKWAISSLHSSVVTGVEIVGDKVITCAGDQRVTLLSWNISGDHISVQPLVQHCCSVPDLKGLALLCGERKKLTLSVYGVGMEVLEIEEEC